MKFYKNNFFCRHVDVSSDGRDEQGEQAQDLLLRARLPLDRQPDRVHALLPHLRKADYVRGNGGFGKICLGNCQVILVVP